MSHRLSRKCLVVVLCSIIATLALPLDAAFLWSAKASVHTDSHDTCISFAQTAMLELHFKNVTKSADEVAGFTGTAYAAITCVGLKPSAVAIVMVASDDQAETTRVAISSPTKSATSQSLTRTSAHLLECPNKYYDACAPGKVGLSDR